MKHEQRKSLGHKRGHPKKALEEHTAAIVET